MFLQLFQRDVGNMFMKFSVCGKHVHEVFMKIIISGSQFHDATNTSHDFGSIRYTLNLEVLISCGVNSPSQKKTKRFLKAGLDQRMKN